MRKPKYEYGNVGKQTGSEAIGPRRCNVCNFCNPLDGHRDMFKDPDDPLGGWLCQNCKKFPLGEAKDFELEEWYLEAVEGFENTVDGSNTYEENIENLVTEWEKVLEKG